MKRIAWLDVLKFLGIVAIYFWHLGEAAGRGYAFILLYHVPLFFFVSGCTESMQSSVTFSQYIKKKVKMILVPFFFFAFLSMLLVIVYERCSWDLVKLMLKQIGYGGIRNQIFAYSLWFLTCLFVMSLLFQILKCLKKRGFIFAAGIVLYVFAARFMPYRPNLIPLLPYNIDCALYYLVYYCTGYCVFPKLKAFLEKEDKNSKWIVGIVGGLCVGYGICTFLGVDWFGVLGNIPIVRIFQPYVTAMVLISANLAVALLLQKIVFFQKMGEETLYLCGSEFLIKTLAAWILSYLGVAVEFAHPVLGMGYVLVLLFILHFVFVPVERWLHKKFINF